MNSRINTGMCLLLSVPDDLLCCIVPASRMLLMSRTCRRIQHVLQRGRCDMDLRVHKKVRYDVRVVKLMPVAVNNLQWYFKIRRFECFVGLRSTQIPFCDFEELTFMHLRVLRMHANQLEEEHLLALLNMFKFSRGLSVFEFTGQMIKCRHVPVLAESITSFSRLEVLNLQNNYFVFDSLELVLDAVQTSCLSTLTLSTNSCEDDRKTLKLCNVLRMNRNTLHVLNLSSMRLCKAEFESLVAAIGACEHLKCLDMSQNHLNYGCLMDLLRAIAECPLTSFNWSGNRLGSAGTFVLANHILHNPRFKTSLTEIKIRMCDVYHGLHYLNAALNLCTSLRTLDLSSNSVFGHEVVDVLQNTSLTSLDISQNFISDCGMRLVLQRVFQSTTLKHLMFSGNHMSKYTLRELRRRKKKSRVSMTGPKTACLCNVCRCL